MTPTLSRCAAPGRAAIVMPAMFALGEEVIANPAVAAFAAFGSFAMLLLVDFGGPMRERLQAQAALVARRRRVRLLGTLASRKRVACDRRDAAGRLRRSVRRGGELGARGGHDRAAARLHPAGLARRPASSIPDRLAGWGIAAAAALFAVALLWPAPTRDPLRRLRPRAPAGRWPGGCARRSHHVMSDRGRAARARSRRRRHAGREGRRRAAPRASSPPPTGPTGLSTSARIVVRLVDELGWLARSSSRPARRRRARPSAARPARSSWPRPTVLERGAELLEADGRGLRSAQLGDGRADESGCEDDCDATPTGTPEERRDTASGGVHQLARSELPRAGARRSRSRSIAHNIDLTAAAERRSWLQRLLGRQPEGLAGTLSRGAGAGGAALRPPLGVAAQQRARRRRARDRRVRRQGDGRPALLLGRARHPVGAALERAQHRARTPSAACSGTVVGFLIGAALLTVDRHRYRRSSGSCSRRRSCWPDSPRRRSPSPPARPRSR